MLEFSWEELARTLFEEMADALVIFDPETQMVMDVNPAMQRLAARGRKETVGQPLNSFLRAENDRRLKQLQHAIRHTTGFHAQEDFLLCSGVGDNWKPVTVTVTRLHGLERPLGLLVLRDVSEQRRNQAEKQQLEKRLSVARKLESAGMLASGVAHEINGLMTLAMSCVDQLSSVSCGESDDEETARSIDILRQVIGQGIGLARSLLSFGRLVPSSWERFDLCELVSQSSRVLRKALGENIELRLVGASAAPVWIEGDPALLQHVLMNLGFNARDAMSDAGALEIGIETKGGAGTKRPCVELWFQDTGRGIPSEDLEKIFEPFFSSKSAGQGIGLGLALVQEIIEAHGAKIRVESEVGRGTTVHIEFPLAADKLSSKEAKKRAKNAVVLLQSRKYLQAILTSALRTLGFDVHGADDEERAIDICGRLRDRIGLLVVDPRLPFDRLWQQASELPIIFVPGNASSNLPLPPSARCRVLEHPFRIADFCKCVEEAVDV